MKVGFASGDWIHPKLTHDTVERWGGSGWARIGQYLNLLPFDVVWGTLIWNIDRFEIRDSEEKYHEVDIVVMQRLMHDGIADNIPKAQANGQKIINDLDDWYWGLSTQNDAFKANHPKLNPRENFNHYRATISRSDLVMVSTPYLLDRISGTVRGVCELVPNYIDVSRFTPKIHTEVETPVVGWVGSTAHRSGDIETVKGVVVPLYKSGEIRLYHGGSHPNGPTFASRLGLPDEAVETAELCPSWEYPSLLTMDIGVVPLSQTPFNRAKSAIKGMEYAAAGVPFVAQDLDAYVQLAQDVGVGRIAKRPTDWLRHIKALRNADIRAEEAAANREKISSCDIAHGVSRMSDILTTV